MVLQIQTNHRSSTLTEKDAMQKVANTRHKVNGQYEVGIPWISDHIDLENNKRLALQRLESLERSLRCEPDVSGRYNEVFESPRKERVYQEIS